MQGYGELLRLPISLGNVLLYELRTRRKSSQLSVSPKEKHSRIPYSAHLDLFLMQLHISSFSLPFFPIPVSASHFHLHHSKLKNQDLIPTSQGKILVCVCVCVYLCMCASFIFLQVFCTYHGQNKTKPIIVVNISSSLDETFPLCRCQYSQNLQKANNFETSSSST